MRYTMKYDFTTILDRKGKDAIALDALGVNNSPRSEKGRLPDPAGLYIF